MSVILQQPGDCCCSGATQSPFPPFPPPPHQLGSQNLIELRHEQHILSDLALLLAHEDQRLKSSINTFPSNTVLDSRLDSHPTRPQQTSSWVTANHPHTTFKTLCTRRDQMGLPRLLRTSLYDCHCSVLTVSLTVLTVTVLF